MYCEPRPVLMQTSTPSDEYLGKVAYGILLTLSVGLVRSRYCHGTAIYVELGAVCLASKRVQPFGPVAAKLP